MAALATFYERIETGKNAEAHVVRFLKNQGIASKYVGAETQFSKEEHYRIKKLDTSNNPILNSIRHYPDLEVGNGTFIQVKSAKNASIYKFVTIEKSSYSACVFLNDETKRVLIIWVFVDGSMWGNWVDQLGKLIEPQTQKDGSGTPFWLINKRNLKPIDLFLDHLR